MTERQYVIPAAQQATYDNFHFAPAVVDEKGTVWCSGVIGSGADGRCVDDPSEQFRQAFANVTDILSEAGCGWGDVVDITSFHIDLPQHLAAFIAAKDEVVAGPYPAWTAIGTTALALRGALVEIKVVAQKG